MGNSGTRPCTPMHQSSREEARTARVDSCHGGTRHAKVPGCILNKGILDETLGRMGILLTSSNKLGVACKGVKQQSLY